MKVAFLDIHSRVSSCVVKDFMGGYGWAFNAGTSVLARAINLVKRTGESLPIMSYGYLAALARQRGHSVVYAKNDVPDADMFVIQSSMVEHAAELAWARTLRSRGKRVVFIGPFSGAMPHLFKGAADIIVRGEPEAAFIRILEGECLSGVIESPAIHDLDSIPFPDWSALPHNEFSYYPALREKPFFPVLASRGCAFQCNYCPYLVSYTWRQRSAENVLDEIGMLIRDFGMKSLLFRDPIFTLDRSHACDIAQGIIRRGYKIRWACETRLDRVDKELMDIMYRSGLRVLNVGIESSDDNVIEMSSRTPVVRSHQEEMIRYCDLLGVRVTAFYMFGMPDDTVETISKTIDYSKRLNTHVAQYFVFTPFPGTEYYESVKDSIAESDWGRFDCYTPVMRHKNLTKAQILKLKEKAFVSYYYRLGWIARFAIRAFRDMVGV